MTQRRALLLSIVVTLLLAFTVVGLRAVAIDDTPAPDTSAQVIRLTDDISAVQAMSAGEDDEDDREEYDDDRDEDDRDDDRDEDEGDDDDDD
jgi:hypothetical protein